MVNPSLQPITAKAGRFLLIYEESFLGVYLSSNVYIAELHGRHYLFDASGHPDLISYLKVAGIPSDSVAAVFLTHGHQDQIMGMVSLSKIGIPAYLNINDFELLKDCVGKWEIRDILGGKCILGDLGLKIISTPYHTPGNTCYYSENERLLISGDTVYSDGNFGRTDLKGGLRDEEESKKVK